MQQADPDFLAIILDVNPVSWALAHEDNNGVTLQHALQCLLTFCNAHLALRDENELAIYGASRSTSQLIFSSVLPSTSSGSIKPDANSYQQFRAVDERVADGLAQMLQDTAHDGDGRMGLVGALAKSLSHINRITRTESKTPAKARILILSVTADSSAQYIPIMNCIFSAQKTSIPIDICKIHGGDTVFLQQASHLTGGSYYRLESAQGMLQYLMMMFLPGRAARKHLNMPLQDSVDLRAACFCHRRIVDIGYVCSVCLSIFCSGVPSCTTCGTKFSSATIKRFTNTLPANGGSPALDT